MEHKQSHTFKGDFGMEMWKEIPNTNGKLFVSSYGRIKSFLRDATNGSILKQTPDKKGYCRIRVTIEREKRSYKVHRLVAEAFLPKREGAEQVNHLDGNKANNSVANLEWVTNAENALHAMKNDLWGNVLLASQRTNEKRKTPIVARSAKTGNVLRFESVSAAERYFNSRHISDVLNGKREKAAGHYFSREVVER